ncbi:IS21 family transposase [Methanospirillum stamsii]|uniref:IS21 family transposase n=1 Tax=Methanospirillum stamsii TaxID=1277351 RepID=UPI003907EA42
MADVQRMATLYHLYGSYSQVARELHISRNTVKKYLRQLSEVRDGIRTEILPESRTIHQPRRIVTDDIIDQIHTLLESNEDRPRKQRMNGRQIHHHIVQSGHQISYTTTKRIIQDWKHDQKSREVFILQSPEPGYRAEFDWGEVTLNIQGVWTRVYLAVMVLTDSLYRFARIYRKESQQEVIDCHIQFFNEICGLPEIVFYDNLLAVFDYHRKIFQNSFIRFAVHYGFSYDVCNIRSPHEKGTDEESVGYIRSQAFSERNSFESFTEAQDWLIESLHHINQKQVYRRELPPKEGLVREQEKMKPLPTLEYSNYFTRSAKISKYSLVVFEGNYYSVPDTFRPRSITLKIFVDRIDLTDGIAIIASHQRLYGKGNYSLDITHYLKTFEKKPGALRHSKVLGQLHEKVQNLYKDYYLDSPLEFIEILKLIQTTSAEGLIYAIDHLAENGIVPGYDTLRLFLFQNLNPMIEPLEIVDPVIVAEPDLTIYDHIMRCEA